MRRFRVLLLAVMLLMLSGYSLEYGEEYDADNESFYSLDGRLYTREDDALIEDIDYFVSSSES